MGNLCSSVSTKEIQFLINHIPTKKSTSLDGFFGEFYQAFIEEMISYMKFFRKIEKE